MYKRTTFTAAIFLALTSLASAMEMKIGDLTIHNPTIRETVPGAKVAAGYITITNNGDTIERIIGGRAEFAGRVELHEMKMVDQVMKMSQLPGGVEIKPGESVALKPGGNHIMFMQLDDALKKGERRQVMLEFENAGKVTLDFHVKSIADTLKLKHGENKHGEHEDKEHKHNH